ncbi:phenylalanine--tRNA ligase subunit beta [Leifsonia xyli subsp. xyli]|uniref:Phenylalanine--tRNA ligase beta subunit n=2 Tax=Leifsonia xyli subsp. xyli TaxID=59736 RepID=SYFB_LEIXX|nr:phenylalanine--tRNA ligase subunit beta [Leifsonia xyli]Q6AGD6.1 RecName: Full=Phenylalanine--tRNA ligase beta subunit; AltName: Full=Phenylalanyl-tRNA synthetase beta subunit; Short=PheRS [Leifsonia xyli subsp. xyli str. CTCB07]AAT88559.1 phenylalanyl-tRNA synthetase, beta subunit [Leifsonia xyli subsp. xyli str. CTCB07]ODA90147.1 phenylalanine--tRNA ligase subunit beta [Leifsonia xyli subsp. xyli]
MRVPLSWLGEYVDLEPGTTPAEVHAALVSVGLEEEGVHTFGIEGPVVVGEVIDFVEEPQSNGKTIRWCQVRVAAEGQKAADGGADVRGIVCGAGNFFPGDKVVVTLPGAALPGPAPLTPFVIAARKTYGHVSDGMIASARELGLGDDHDGILRLSTLGLDPEVGADAVSLLGLDDTAVEVNVTPDRGYAFSIRGIAREYAHATGAAFRDPAEAVASPPPHAHGFSVAVEDRAPIRDRVGASVFVTRVVRDVDATRPTPPWMVARLKLAGIRSISLVVDITNYVMLELGQPTHGYDLDRLSGGIVVRRAHAGETLVTLDDQTRALHAEDLLITDDSGAIGLAGVMGGASTEIGAGTRNVLVEAANFDPVSIARTARRHKLPSEASKRFERGVDPRVAVAAAARVVQLLEQLAGGTADGLGSLLDETADAEPIRLPDDYIPNLIGVAFTDDEVRGALAEIGGSVSDTEGALLVVPPTWRPDLRDKSDLAEEVARIVGFDRIPSVLPVAPPGRGLSRAQTLRRAVAQTLADNGATEVLAFPFVGAAQNDLFGSPEPGGVPAVKLANPLDATAAYLRTSLLPGLLGIAKRNLARGLVDLSVYETGTVFLPGAALGSETLPPGAALPSRETLAGLNAGIPDQPRHLAGVVLGHTVRKQPGQPAVAAGLADALAMVDQAAAAVGVAVEPVQSRHQALHPGRTAQLVAGDGVRTVLGYAGELSPALAAELDLPRVVAVFELDLDALIAVAPAEIVAGTIAGFPAATQDLSLVVGDEVPAGEVLRAVREGAGALLEDIRLVDDYRGTGLPDSSKSLTFALRFRADDRTLTAAEASEAKQAGAARAGQLFGAAIRE